MSTLRVPLYNSYKVKMALDIQAWLECRTIVLRVKTCFGFFAILIGVG